MKKRWLQAAALSVALLTACAAPPEPLSPEPVGGYAETRITLPEGGGDLLFPHKDGTLDLMGLLYNDEGEDMVVHHYSPDGGVTWQQQDTEGWMQDLARQCGLDKKGVPIQNIVAANLLAVDMDDGRNLYCVLFGEGASHRLFQVPPQGEARELIIPDWRMGGSSETYGVSALHVEEDMVGVSFWSRLARYSGEGYERKISSQSSSQEFHQAVFTPESTAAMTTDGDLILFDAGTGAELYRVEPPHWRDIDLDCALGADRDGAVYTATRFGVERLGPGGALFETVLDGERYSFGGETCVVDDVHYLQEQDTFYVGFVHFPDDFRDGARSERMLCRYTYDPDLPMSFARGGDTNADTDD